MMSRLHALLRSETIFLGLTATLAALAAALAFARLGYFGLLLLGLVTLTIGLRLALEEDGPTGSGHTPGLYAASRREPDTHDERWERDGERSRLRRSLRFVNVLGAVLVLVGGAGFWWVQLA
ncbi:MAG TPA: hypothetical protein VEA41_07430 [Salinarimonas sp.]|jgi:hypothetical protein|nr:hypothetical protein [Salinarimonas sp.]